MSQLKWALPLALSVSLSACSGEESSTPAPDAGSNPSGAAAGSQDPAGKVADELDGSVDEATEAAVTEAKALIEKVTGHLEDNKPDLAKTAFAQLEALKSQLPASYQAQIDTLGGLIEAKGLGEKANNLLDSLGGG